MVKPSQEWYFSTAGRRCGPVSAASLKEHAKNGQLLRNDLVWKAGMNNWVQAGTVHGLFDLDLAATPPPIPSVPVDIPRYSVYDGIVFCEKDLPTFVQIKNVTVAIHGYFFLQAQLKNLDDVKEKMAVQARASGGICITRFSYGQKSNWITTLLGLDDVSWYGSGIIGRLPDPLYREMIR